MLRLATCATKIGSVSTMMRRSVHGTAAMAAGSAGNKDGLIKEFMLKNYRHFNAASTVEAAQVRAIAGEPSAICPCAADIVLCVFCGFFSDWTFFSSFPSRATVI